MPKALAVPASHATTLAASQGPPADAMEYLRQVREEANRLPNVSVARMNLKEMKKKQVRALTFYY
jgi:hypothetical protein